MRFLIVDDIPQMRLELGKILRQGFNDSVEIEESGDANSAMEHIRCRHFDIVLIDISLGESSGFNLLKQVRSERPDQPVLICSIYPEKMFASASQKLGAAGYLEKRFAMSELAVAVRKILICGKYVH